MPPDHKYDEPAHRAFVSEPTAQDGLNQQRPNRREGALPQTPEFATESKPGFEVSSARLVAKSIAEEKLVELRMLVACDFNCLAVLV